MLARSAAAIAERRVLTALSSLHEAISASGGPIPEWRIVIAVNGCAYLHDTAMFVDDAMHRLFGATGSFEVRVEELSSNSKIEVVNGFVDRASGEGCALIVMDDDLRVPRAALAECAAHLAHPRAPILGFRKAAAPLSRSDGTIFQHQLHSFFDHTNLERLAAVAGLAVRPTGSFYCVPVSRLMRFPEPCNEAEVLPTLGCALARSVVLTWYPLTAAAELVRRRHQLETHLATPLSLRWKDAALHEVLRRSESWSGRFDSSMVTAAAVLYEIVESVARGAPNALLQM